MRLALALLPVLVLGGCTFDALNISVVVFPKEYGKAEIIRISVDSPPSADRLFEGAEKVKSNGVKVESFDAIFDDINDFEIGGITYEFEEREVDSGFEMTVRIPTTSEAKWFKRLGYSEDDIEALEGLSDRKPGPDQERDGPKEPTVVFRVTMPGVVERNRLRNKDVPEEWKLDVEAPPNHPMSLSPERNMSAVLRIPLRDILEGETDEVVWKIRCGRTTELCRQDWKKFLEERKSSEEEEE